MLPASPRPPKHGDASRVVSLSDYIKEQKAKRRLQSNARRPFGALRPAAIDGALSPPANRRRRVVVSPVSASRSHEARPLAAEELVFPAASDILTLASPPRSVRNEPAPSVEPTITATPVGASAAAAPNDPPSERASDEHGASSSNNIQIYYNSEEKGEKEKAGAGVSPPQPLTVTREDESAPSETAASRNWWSQLDNLNSTPREWSCGHDALCAPMSDESHDYTNRRNFSDPVLSQ